MHSYEYCLGLINTSVANPNENIAALTTTTTPATSKSPKRLITNLKDFSRLAKAGSSSAVEDRPPKAGGLSSEDRTEVSSSRLAKAGGSSSEDRSEPCLTLGSSTDDFEDDDDDNEDLVKKIACHRLLLLQSGGLYYNSALGYRYR